MFKRRVCAFLLAAFCLCAPTAHAVWADRADLIYRSAHTLDEGEFEFGIFTPLQYGVSDQVQIALHPILLLVLTPHASLRWRVLPEGPLTLALDLDLTWSFLDEVDDQGRRVADATCNECGFPGTMQLTGTMSWEVVDGLTWSFGTGIGVDVLDLNPQRGMLELHTSFLWLIDSENLLMLHGNINVHPWDTYAATSREYVQFMYAHALGALHIGVGLAVGEFIFVEDGKRTNPGISGNINQAMWHSDKVLQGGIKIIIGDISK